MSRTIVLQAGEPQEFYEVSNFFRILESSGPLSVEFYFQGREVAEALDVTEGYAEKFEIGQFDRVRLLSPTTQTVQFVQRLGNSVLYDKAPVGDSNIVGSVPLALDAATLAALASVDLKAATINAMLTALESIDLNAATLNTLIRPLLPAQSYSNKAVLAVNTPITIFAPGANVNGAIIHSASFADQHTAPSVMTLIAKASAPAGTDDGQIIMLAGTSPVSGGNYMYAQKEVPTRIAPGLGLYIIASSASVGASPVQSVRYTLL